MQLLKNLSVVLMMCWISSALGLTKVDITRGNVEPLPIAMPIFISDDKEFADNVTEVVANDLEGTGLFRIIDRDSYIENISDINATPEFISWRQINTAALIIGVVNKLQSNNVTAEIKMWDAFAQRLLTKHSFTVPVRNWRTVSHKIADEIYKHLTGEKGYFNTRIVYVSIEPGPDRYNVRRIAIMDQDGHNLSYLTGSERLLLTPRFSPNSHDLLYMAYQGRYARSKPKIWTMNIATKSSRIVGEFPGSMSFAPRYLNNGKHALLAVEKSGVSNIYAVDLASMSSRQLTHCSSICVSPSASPNQDKIVFNSDMSGSKQLYVMDANGSNVKRISFGDGYYSGPVWSPRGDLIAFTKMVPDEGFYIGVMRPDGSGERTIARGWLVEGAAWSPNGRVIMYEKQKRAGEDVKLYTIDITGSNERMLNTPFGASDASWSNLLN